MPRESTKWDSRQYLKFERERTLPCRDLVARVQLDAPASIADLGCGPGNSTSVLAERWPRAKMVGVDSSEEMLAKARKSSIRAEWVLTDIRDWSPREPCDLIFSNAALHWIADQRRELVRLLGLVSGNGAFAFQIPSKAGAWRRVLSEVAGGPRWRDRFPSGAVALHSGRPSFYYDLLAPHSSQVDLWETEYVHVLPGPEAIVEWTKGSALRPLLDALSRQETGTFLKEYALRIARAYPRRPDGNVLFPFRRLFVIAYR